MHAVATKSQQGHLMMVISKEKTVVVYGHFTSIHAGHIRYLKHAKEKGNNLILCLSGDGTAKNKYRYNQKLRAEAIRLLGIVDRILYLRDVELLEAIKGIEPDILVLGTEHEKSANPVITSSVKYMKESKKEILYHAGEIQYASTDLLDESIERATEKRTNKLIEVCKKYKIEKNDMIELLEQSRSKSVLIIGDIIIDEFTACEAMGMSAEAPVIVVKELRSKKFVGGAGIVSMHVKELGCRSQLISVVGDDEASNSARQILTDCGVENDLIVDQNRPTSYKKRYMVDNQKLFRVSRLEEKGITGKVEEKLLAKILERIETTDCVIVSDFVYGVITKKVLDCIRYECRKRKIPLIGDIQCSSQVGMVTKFVDFDLICPNEKEARISLQDKESGLEKLSRNLIDQTKCRSLLMKLSAEGFIIFAKDKEGNYFSQSFPALSSNPVDVAGAGDSMLAIYGMTLAGNIDMIKGSVLACFMAAISVEKMGNSPVSKIELIDKISSMMD